MFRPVRRRLTLACKKWALRWIQTNTEGFTESQANHPAYLLSAFTYSFCPPLFFLFYNYNFIFPFSFSFFAFYFLFLIYIYSLFVFFLLLFFHYLFIIRYKKFNGFYECFFKFDELFLEEWTFFSNSTNFFCWWMFFYSMNIIFSKFADLFMNSMKFLWSRWTIFKFGELF